MSHGELVIRSTGEEETTRVGALLGGLLEGGSVVALLGPLGAGKTSFVRGLARGLGLDEGEVVSPTFVISQEHVGAAGRALVHIDAYRIGAADLDSIGWDEMVADPDAVIAVEWADRVAERLPGRAIPVSLEHAGPADRTIRVRAPGHLLERLAGLLHPPCPTCGRAASAELAPFCSTRCRLVDLGRWMSGGYAISRPLEAEEEPGADDAE
jgi:tRNA threonylcarbamoyladenosine biosynthesis protein TsaE